MSTCFSARAPADVGRQRGEARGDRRAFFLSQDPEPAAGDRAQHVLAVLAQQVVLAVAEEREVVVAQPLEERTRFGELLRVDGRRALGELGDDVPGALPHRPPVLDGGAHVAEDAAQVVAELLDRRRVGQPVELDVDQRLVAPIVRSDLEQPAAVVAAQPHDRAHDEVDRPPVPAHLHRDRVDEERHVVVHDLDDGVRRLPAVLLQGRRVDVHLELAGPPNAREAPVRERRPGEVELAPVDQVLGSDVGVVGADEPLDVGRFVILDRAADARNDPLEESDLRLVRARRHSRISSRKEVWTPEGFQSRQPSGA